MTQAANFRRLAICGALLLASAAFAQKKPLDEGAYDIWKSVVGTTLSDNGKWIFYRISPQEGDSVTEIKRTDDSKTYTIERVITSSFTADGKFLVAITVPKFAELKELRRKKTKPEDMPKNTLVILNLETGDQKKIENVTSFTIADDDTGWIAYRPEPPKPTPPAKTDDKKPEEKKPDEKKSEEAKKKADHKPGDAIVLLNLNTGVEDKLVDVATYRFSKDGKTLVYALSTKDGKGDGVVWDDLATNKKTNVVTGLGHYTKLVLDEKATKLAFLTDKDDYAAKKPAQAIYLFTQGKLNLLAKADSTGIPSGSWIPESSALSISHDADRVFFATAPRPAEEKPSETADEDKVSLDIWNWQDKILQPQQLLQAAAKRAKSFEAVILLNDQNKIVQLETPQIPSVRLGAKQESAFAIGTNGEAYDMEQSWDTGYDDVYLIDVSSGAATKIISKLDGSVSISPTGKYAYVYNQATRVGSTIDMATGNQRVITSSLPDPLWDIENDIPANPNAYGSGGWTKDDSRIILYDQYDAWSVDPTGSAKPVNLTNGFGRSSHTALRVIDTDPEADFVDTTKPVLLKALDDNTKASGYFWGDFARATVPSKIMMADKLFVGPVKAKKADTVYFQEQDFDEYPDVWVADNLNLQNPKKLSNANPQQKDFNWGKAELINWTSNDGAALQGILIKPENFDYAKKYPMITYFYEKNADTIHAYRTPSPTASILNPTMAVSNGYIVFIPDIVYKEGYPGESAISCIMPGVQEVLRRGYVDPTKLAIDGQSWGGYQVAYMITETNMFKCAYAGAPVVDMFSAYGGIRWGSGLVREFQYEKTQSRIGGTVWDKPLRFLENSPLFFMDKVQTPVLIMANDKDGSVPWYQGIEMFTGLRRLQKPSWLLVYNDEDHNLIQRKNRKDLSKRKQQFYDYYLKGAPMPDWMSKGVPAVDKGKEYGFGTASK
ncbi:prolyl oligopeptidase family serine peptidase [soil metagenome]